MRTESLVTTDGYDRTCHISEPSEVALGLRAEPRYYSHRATEEEIDGQIVRLRTRCFDATGQELARDFPRHIAATILLYRHYLHLEHRADDGESYTDLATTFWEQSKEFGVDEDTLATPWFIDEVLSPRENDSSKQGEAEWFAILINRNFVTKKVRQFRNVPVFQDDESRMDVFERCASGQYGSLSWADFENGSPEWDQLSEKEKNGFDPEHWIEMFDVTCPTIYATVDEAIRRGRYLKK